MELRIVITLTIITQIDVQYSTFMALIIIQCIATNRMQFPADSHGSTLYYFFFMPLRQKKSRPYSIMSWGKPYAV